MLFKASRLEPSCSSPSLRIRITLSALDVLSKEGYLVRDSDVIPAVIGDRPGGLAAVLRVLADAEVDVEYTYAFVAHSRDNAYVILRVEDDELAINALIENGVSLLSAEEVYGY